MIKYKDGMNISERTVEEIKRLLRNNYDRLSKSEKDVLNVLLDEIKGGGTSLLELLSELEYDEPMVDIETWLIDDFYFKKAHNLWPQLMDDMIELFSGDYHEVILSGSIGWGKSYFAKVAACRVIYEISCMRHPQRSFGLAPNSTIAIVALSVSEKLAKKVLLDGMQRMISNSPYFMSKFKPKATQTELKFPKQIWLTASSTTQNSIIGLDLISAIIDETNFMGGLPKGMKASHMRHGHIDNAELLYEAIKRRIKSRYMKYGKLPGKLFLVSSKRTLTDFTERRIAASIDDPHVFVREYSQWGAKPAKVFLDNKFYVVIGNATKGSKILTMNEKPEDYRDADTQVVAVPEDFRDDFEKDIDSAIRDIAGIATVAVMPFIRNREKIDAIISDEYSHPFTQDVWDMTPRGKLITKNLFSFNSFGEKVPKIHCEAPRYIHIDPSIRGDATGFAMGHIYGDKIVKQIISGAEIVERRPLIQIDLILKIKPSLGEDINFSEIRKLIYVLTNMGMPIRYISMDSYQSFDSIQAFRAKGYDSEVVSVDRPMHAYDSLKATIYESRLKCYDYPLLIDELKRLEFDIVRNKVDHPSDGEKDLADALCGVVYSLNTKFKGEPIGFIDVDGKKKESVLLDDGDVNWVPDETWEMIDSESSAWFE